MADICADPRCRDCSHSDPRRGPAGLTTSGSGRTLSRIVLQHLLQQRSPDRRVGERGIWQAHAGSTRRIGVFWLSETRH